MCNGDRGHVPMHHASFQHSQSQDGSPRLSNIAFLSSTFSKSSEGIRSWKWICPKSTPRLPPVLSPTSKLTLCVTFSSYSPDCPHITLRHPLPWVLTWPYASRDSNRFTNRNDHPAWDRYYSNWAAINIDLFDVGANRPWSKLSGIAGIFYARCPLPSYCPHNQCVCAPSEVHNEGAITSK